VGDQRTGVARWAAGGAALVAFAGCMALLTLRVANSGPEVPGRNWWLIADALLALAYLPAGALLLVWPGRRWLGLAFVVVAVTQLGSGLLAEWSAWRGHLGQGAGSRPADVVETVGLLVLVLVVPPLLPWRPADRRRDPLRWWFALGVAASVVGAFPAVIPVHDLPGADVVGPLLLVATIPLIVVAAVVATVRDESVDLASHRFLVWVVLLAGVGFVYTAVVAGFGELLGTDGPAWLLVAATGLIALLLEPARRAADRLVDHAVYGDRDDALTLVRHVVQHVTTAVDVDALLPSVVSTLGRSMRLDLVAVDVHDGAGWERMAMYGVEVERVETFALGSGDDEVGRLVVGCADSRGLRGRDRAVLVDVAPHVWLAVVLVRLTAALRRSNLAVLSGREEERRRMRRDLHDGMGPALTGISMAVRTLANRLERDGSEAANVALAKRIADEVDASAREVKRIVRDLRPAELDNEGLPAALVAFVRRLDGGVHVDLDVPETSARLPAVVEVAAYRITTEALTNVVRHARASTCRVRLVVDDVVDFDVVDDGVGVRPDEPAGVGLVSMRERVAALGGSMAVMPVDPHGTRLRVTLPAVVR
jgi:two-component system, NarL family, sensor kinase